VRDRDAAGVGSAPPDGGAGPAWNTYVCVESADAAVERARAAGGEVLVEPFDAPPAGRLAALADPAGASICVWEAGDREGAQVINERAAWAMSLLATPDPEAAMAYYGEVFGWETDAFEVDGAEFWLWRLPGFVGGEAEQPVPRDVVAVMAPAPSGTPAAWAVDFWVADVDEAASRAARLGGAVVSEPRTSSLGREATLADPEGATFTVTRVAAAR
jgi:predicted enzyme related to lactoylglutathione lyase